MRVILTGASSFIGRATARELERAGHEVTKLRHSFEDGEIPLPERADVWIHFAWAGVGSEGRSDRKIQDYNMEMSFSALKKATELGCGSFLFAGSQAEYGRRSEYGRIVPAGRDPRPVPAGAGTTAPWSACRALYVRL